MLQSAVIHTNTVTPFSVCTMINLCTEVGLVGSEVAIVSLAVLPDQLRVLISEKGTHVMRICICQSLRHLVPLLLVSVHRTSSLAVGR
jgi:hypothetical protein